MGGAAAVTISPSAAKGRAPVVSSRPGARGAGSDLSEAVDIACQAWESTGAPAAPAVAPRCPRSSTRCRRHRRTSWSGADRPPRRAAAGPVDLGARRRSSARRRRPRTGRTTALHSLVSRMGSALRSHVVVHLVAPPSPATDRARGSRTWRPRRPRRPVHDSPAGRPPARGHRLTARGAAGERPSGYEQWWADWRRGEADPPRPSSWSPSTAGRSSPGRPTSPTSTAPTRSSPWLATARPGHPPRRHRRPRAVLGRLGSLARRRLVLHLPDRGDVLAAGAPPSLLPADAVPGRGALLPDGVLAQVALPVPPGRPSTTSCDPWRWRVVDLPASVALDDLPHAEGSCSATPATRTVPSWSRSTAGPGGRRARPVGTHHGSATARRAAGDGVGPSSRSPHGRRSSSRRRSPSSVPRRSTLRARRPVARGPRRPRRRPRHARRDTLDPVLRSYASHCARSGDVLLAASSSTAAASFRGSPRRCAGRVGACCCSPRPARTVTCWASGCRPHRGSRAGATSPTAGSPPRCRSRSRPGQRVGHLLRHNRADEVLTPCAHPSSEEDLSPRRDASSSNHQGCTHRPASWPGPPQWTVSSGRSAAGDDIAAIRPAIDSTASGAATSRPLEVLRSRSPAG